MRVFTAGCWCSAIVIAAAWLLAVPSAQRPRFDVVIANGRIVDGTGAPWFRGDVGITGDRIAAIGALGDATAGDDGSTPPTWSSRRASSICSASRSSTCSSTAAPPARSCRASRPR